MDAAALQGVALRKINPQDRSSPILPSKDVDSIDGAAQYRAALLECNVEQWYPYLKEHTMRTVWIPISMEAARDIVHAAKSKLNDRPKSLLQLEADLEDLLQSQFGSEGAFIRTSTRSPKDSPACRNKSKQHLVEELRECGDDANERHVALLRASLQGMKAHTGAEALSLLTTSERVHTDLAEMLEEKGKQEVYNVVLREWVDIPVEKEFRAFVHNKKMTALCQYYHVCFFPGLQKEFKELTERIQGFFDREIKDLLPLSSYIIDFGVLADRIMVIELNPFSIATNPVLFSWKQDRVLLENGPFTAKMLLEKPEMSKGVEIAIQALLDE